MVKKLLLLLFVCASLMGCISCEKGSRKEAVKKETTKEYVYEYRYYWLRQGLAINAGDYIAHGLHDSVRVHFAAGISRIERGMQGMVKFIEVKDIAQADFVVSGVSHENKAVLAWWDSKAKLICINLNASGGHNLGITLAHEILHMCGLGHSNDPNSLMFWGSGNKIPVFTKADRENLRTILEGKSL